jgi:hypothetical protein
MFDLYEYRNSPSSTKYCLTSFVDSTRTSRHAYTQHYAIPVVMVLVLRVSRPRFDIDLGLATRCECHSHPNTVCDGAGDAARAESIVVL